MSYMELKNINYKYNGMEESSLRNINLEIDKGELILISGRSGCGKTSLCRCINGLIPRFFEGELSGEFLIGGKNTSGLESHELARLVSSVFQDPRSQFFTTDTTAEVAFGCENLSLPPEEIKRRVDSAFKDLGIENLRDRSVFGLSGGERQKIAIASVTAMSPEIYVMDEPSANLDDEATAELAGILGRLKGMGKTIIISEHKLYYLKDLFDRFIFIEKGMIRFIKSRDEAARFTAVETAEMGLRSFAPGTLPKPDYTDRTTGVSPDNRKPVLQVRNLSFGYRGAAKRQALSGISLEAFGGEIIGITGPNGAGKTTLARLICGLLKEKSGEIIMHGKRLAARRRPGHTYFIMQDADYQLFTESVEEELRLGNEKQENLEERITQTLEALDLSEYGQIHPQALSGGQKQRVTIAAANIKACDIIIFDEPTSGLDAAGMYRTGKLIKNLARGGKTIFVISHDLELLTNACTRMLRIENGKVTVVPSENRKMVKILKEALQ